MEQNEKKKFPKGALIGIIIGAVVLVIAVIAVIVALVAANHKKEIPDTNSEEITNTESVSSEEPEEKTEEVAEDKTENGPFTVTFRYNDKDFGTQTVEKGEKANEPLLMPAEEGSWDFDFNTVIEEDTVIEWK